MLLQQPTGPKMHVLFFTDFQIPRQHNVAGYHFACMPLDDEPVQRLNASRLVLVVLCVCLVRAIAGSFRLCEGFLSRLSGSLRYYAVRHWTWSVRREGHYRQVDLEFASALHIEAMREVLTQ